MLTEAGELIVKERYCIGGEETWADVCRRVAEYMSRNEKDRDKYNTLFLDQIYNLKFLPASPVFFNAGDEPQGSMSPCFGLVVQDNMESIMENARLVAMILKYGGGVGLNLSYLRAKGTIIKSTHGKATGPVGVLKHYDSVGTMVCQAGKRDAAMLAMLDMGHFDIEEFIKCKDEEGTLENFNISVKMTGESFRYEHDMSLIAEQIWKNGEPGILFWDHIQADNFSDTEPLDTINPCGETPTVDRGACCLGSINLVKFFKDNSMDWVGLKNTVRIGVRFLDNLLDMNTYPDESIEKRALLYRQIGLGVMGLADLFILHGYEYGDKKSIELTHEVFEFIKAVAENTSEEISVRVDTKRNSTLLSVAPTGSLHRIANVSPGIEPNYARETESIILGKKVRNKHWLAGEDAFVTALEVDPYRQIDVVAAAQKYVDLGISKTVNLPNDTTPDTILKCIHYAHEKGLKGITFYRDGSRKKQQIIDVKKGKTMDRPCKLKGETHVVETGLGKLYVTINEKDGKPIELFATIGKAGNDVGGFSEAMGRLVSLALRNGIPPEKISHHLKWISGSAFLPSVPHAISGVLEQYGNGEVFKEEGANICPECGNGLEFSEGCESCTCGYSRC